jgi:hypothetical protein
MGIYSLANSSINNWIKYSNAAAGNGQVSDFELITSQVIASPQTSVTFANLQEYSQYKHLQIRAIARTTQAVADSNISINFNNDTGATYWTHLLYGNGSSALASGNTSAQTSMTIGEAPGSTGAAYAFGAAIIDILDSFSTVKNKTVKSLTGMAQSANYIVLRSGSWSSTAAISSITLSGYGGSSLASGTRFSLYGAK